MEEKREGPYSRRGGAESTQHGTEEGRLVAALQYMGDTFTGNNHGEAYDRLRAMYPEYDKQLVTEGWTTPTGGFLTREDIKRMRGGTG